MLFILSLVALSLGGVVQSQDETFAMGSYSFFFHDDHNLLLTVHADSCYYTAVLDNSLEEKLHTYKTQVENFVIESIQHARHRMTLVSLDYLRIVYEDLLADFHCLDKQVYLLPIDLSALQTDSGPTTESPHVWNTPVPHTPAPDTQAPHTQPHHTRAPHG